MREDEEKLRPHLRAALAAAGALSGFAGALADAPLVAVPRGSSPLRLADGKKGWGYPVEASRAELAGLLAEALDAHKDAVLLLEDRRSKRSDPWVERYGVGAPHLFVDEQLVVLQARADRPSRGQLQDALRFGDASATLVGVVVVADPALLDLEGDDVARADLEALCKGPPLALFAAAFEGEGFLLLRAV
jgi:hypothetical protein